MVRGKVPSAGVPDGLDVAVGLQAGPDASEPAEGAAGGDGDAGQWWGEIWSGFASFSMAGGYKTGDLMFLWIALKAATFPASAMRVTPTTRCSESRL